MTCPVLVVHGAEDAVRPPEIGRELATATGGRYVELSGCGHAPHLRKPVLVNGLLREFVEQVTGAGDTPGLGLRPAAT